MLCVICMLFVVNLQVFGKFVVVVNCVNLIFFIVYIDKFNDVVEINFFFINMIDRFFGVSVVLGIVLDFMVLDMYVGV